MPASQKFWWHHKQIPHSIINSSYVSVGVQLHVCVCVCVCLCVCVRVGVGVCICLFKHKQLRMNIPTIQNCASAFLASRRTRDVFLQARKSTTSWKPHFCFHQGLLLLQQNHHHAKLLINLSFASIAALHRCPSAGASKRVPPARRGPRFVPSSSWTPTQRRWRNGKADTQKRLTGKDRFLSPV